MWVAYLSSLCPWLATYLWQLWTMLLRAIAVAAADADDVAVAVAVPGGVWAWSTCRLWRAVSDN